MTAVGGTASPPEVGELLETFVTGLRGETLRAQLAARHHERAPEEIEDAIQTACKCFLEEAEGIADPGRVYKWIRTAAHRALNRERDLLERQVSVDPFSERFDVGERDSGDSADEGAPVDTEPTDDPDAPPAPVDDPAAMAPDTTGGADVPTPPAESVPPTEPATSPAEPVPAPAPAPPAALPEPPPATATPAPEPERRTKPHSHDEIERPTGT